MWVKVLHQNKQWGSEEERKIGFVCCIYASWEGVWQIKTVKKSLYESCRAGVRMEREEDKFSRWAGD